MELFIVLYTGSFNLTTSPERPSVLLPELLLCYPANQTLHLYLLFPGQKIFISTYHPSRALTAQHLNIQERVQKPACE